MDAITTTVTWEDLISAYDAELQEYHEAYSDLEVLATDEFDADLTTPTSDDELSAIQQQAARYDAAAQELDKRQHVLENLRDELGDGPFELKMLTGQETMRIERELRMEAHEQDIPVSVIQTKRNQMVADTATVDAPEGIPRGEDGPEPSQAPNALTLALFEQIERYNNAGATDFRPAGCGDETASLQSASSPRPSSSPESSVPSAPTGDE